MATCIILCLFLTCFFSIWHVVTSKKPYKKRLLATWRLECELGIISDLECPIDGSWSPWAPWSACHGTCDNLGFRKRIRECNNPAPSQDGIPCSGLDEQIESCYLSNCTTEDYRKIVEGDIPRTQALKQLEAMPGFMDQCLQMECPYEAVEAVLAKENTWQLNSESIWNSLQCVKHDIGCPVTGEWGTWGSWSTCGARCGKGQRWRIRQCDTPPPSEAHLVCTGAPLQHEECEGDQCAIDGEYQDSISGSWGEWGEWNKCSENCGAGIQQRKRACMEKNITNFAITWGTHCRGQYDQMQVCNNKKCILNGGWSGWSSWGPCSQTCGAGRRSRTRSCTRPVPSDNGSDCIGPKTGVGSCHLQPCEVYNHMISIFNGDSLLQYYFPRKRSTFFHFYIRFMPLSPHGNLIRRGLSPNPLVRLSLHNWHICLDVNGAVNSCVIPRMCSLTALEPATWNTVVITVTNTAASIRLNDARASVHGSFTCDPEFSNDVINVHLGERLHGEVQELILNFIPLNMIIQRERRSDRSDFFPTSASNMAYEKANMEEAYLHIHEDQYLRLPCFQSQDEWQLELTIRPKRESGSIILIPSDLNKRWFYMSLQNMRLKIKFAHDDFKSESISSTECLPDQWLDISITKKKEINTIEVSLNDGERLHVFLMDDNNIIDNQESHKCIKRCSNLNKELILKQSRKDMQCKTYIVNKTKPQQICTDEFFIGGLPTDVQNALSENFSPFTGIIASIRVNNKLIDLHDCTLERDKDGVTQVSSRTASISGAYHETAWGETNKFNLTCLYARNIRSPNRAYWLYMDTVLQFNKNVRSADDGRVLRLIVSADNDLKGFYTCRARGNKRTRNFVTYGVLGKINYKLSRPDTITFIAVCTTIALVIFTLSWLFLEGYYDIRDGYGFYRDANYSPEEEAEVVCKYIDQNVNLIGSQSAVNLAKARARRRGRRLASRASFGVPEPEGMLKIEKEIEDLLSDDATNEPEELPPLPENNVLGIEPSHEVYRCEQSYVSSPRHGSNISSCVKKTTLSSSTDSSPRVLCSRLLMMKHKYSPQESNPKKNLNRSYFNIKDKSNKLLTIQSSTVINKSPVQKVLEKFQDLRTEDT